MPRSTLSAVRTPSSDEAQLDQRDRHRRPHPDHHRLRVEHARHRRDVAEHPADERVHDLERRDVDEHAARAASATIRSVRSSCSVSARRSCMSTWIVTRRNSPIFRIGIRPCVPPLRPARSRERRTGRCASQRHARSASASVALVTTSPSSTPRCTMVCAICGRMPLMMQSAPISRAAATVLRRCCATSVSTVGHAGDVDDRDLRAGLHDALEQALHDDLGARAVQRADQRQRQHAVPELDHRRRQLQHLLAAAAR